MISPLLPRKRHATMADLEINDDNQGDNGKSTIHHLRDENIRLRQGYSNVREEKTSLGYEKKLLEESLLASNECNYGLRVKLGEAERLLELESGELRLVIEKKVEGNKEELKKLRAKFRLTEVTIETLQCEVESLKGATLLLCDEKGIEKLIQDDEDMRHETDRWLHSLCKTAISTGRTKASEDCREKEWRESMWYWQTLRDREPHGHRYDRSQPPKWSARDVIANREKEKADHENELSCLKSQQTRDEHYIRQGQESCVKSWRDIVVGASKPVDLEKAGSSNDSHAFPGGI